MKEITITPIYNDEGGISHYSILVNDSDEDLFIEIPSGCIISFEADSIRIDLHNSSKG